jgi:uncharacterized LabA/DUF88 family protein
MIFYILIIHKHQTKTPNMSSQQLTAFISQQIAKEMAGFFKTKKIGAIFVDLENLYFSPWLKLVTIRTNRYEFIREIIENVKIILREKYNCTTNATNAYANFEKLTHLPMSEFSYNGVNLHFVPGTDQKNSADMQMCIDIARSVYEKPEIDTYVLITGDIDFMPALKFLNLMNKNVFIASFSDSLSGNVRKLIDNEHILMCEDLLSPANKEKLMTYKAAQIQKEKEQEEKRQKMEIPWNEVVAGSTEKSTNSHNPAKNPEPIKKQSIEKIPIKKQEPAKKQSIEKLLSKPELQNSEQVLVANFTNNPKNWKEAPPDDQYFWAALMLVHVMEKELRTKEVWLTPYLRRLTEKLPNLSCGARKGLLANMEKNGVIAISESQLGEGNKFSVIIVNDKHPDVQKTHRIYAEKQARCERAKAIMPADDDFPPAPLRTFSTECIVDGSFDDTSPDDPSIDGASTIQEFKAQSRNPPVTMHIDQIIEVFSIIFKNIENWIRASSLGDHWKKHTDMNFKDAKRAAVECGFLVTRGVGGHHEVALASVVKPKPQVPALNVEAAPFTPSA